MALVLSALALALLPVRAVEPTNACLVGYDAATRQCTYRWKGQWRASNMTRERSTTDCV